MNWFFLIALLAVSCSSGGSHKPPPAVEWRFDENGIHSIKFHGQELIGPNVGGYYIIGSCGGADDPDNNLHSRIMVSPSGACPPTPSTMEIRQVQPNTLHSVITIGPMSVATETFSVPLDFDRNVITTYEFPFGPLFINGNSISQGLPSGMYAVIPQPFVSRLGNVGFIHSGRSLPWIEARSATARVRRVFGASSNISDVIAYNHFGTHNIEANLTPAGTGQTVMLEEDVTVY